MARARMTHEQYFKFKSEMINQYKDINYIDCNSTDIAKAMSKRLDFHVSVYNVRLVLKELGVTFKGERKETVSLEKRVTILENIMKEQGLL